MRQDPPPFRADMVGSLLRTAALRGARKQFAAGRLTREQLAEVEDDEIEKIVRKQELIGLQGITDGEFRRSQWHFDFYWGLKGVDETQRTIQFKGIETGADNVRVTGRLAFHDHPMIGHFKFLQTITNRTPKMTIPSPSVLHFRTGREEISVDAYPDLDRFFADLAQTYKVAVQAFHAAGCRYLQLDDTVFAHLCDREQRQRLRSKGDDPDALARTYIETINEALAGRPPDLRITTHSCRGNYRSRWFSQGGYEPIADRLFNQLEVDGFFLEYDTARAGGFAPLRFLPKGKLAVLGLITTKTDALEPKDELKRRIDEATQYADLEQLCISPQCGFASTEEGNLLAEDTQWRKLALTVEVAAEVWG